MRIGHFAFGLNDPGGVRSYVLALAEAQRAEGDAVHLLDDVARRSDVGAPPGWPVHFAEGPGHLRTLCRQLGIDLLHAHSSLPEDPGVPVVRTLHGHHAYCPSGSRFLERSARPCPRVFSPLGCLAGHFLDHCGSVRPARMAQAFGALQAEAAAVRSLPTIAISEFQRQSLARAGVPTERVRVVRHPAWRIAAGFEPPEDEGEPWLLFMGRLVPAKGAAWLLRAVARSSGGFRLAVAGEGPEGGGLARLAGELGLDGRVRFLGWCDAERAAAWRARCRALVVPSLWHEPAGLVAVEAAAAGRAVIASVAGGLPEYVANGASGLLVPPGDEPALARALEALAGDAALAERLGRGGLEMVRSRHAVTDHLQALGEVYRGAA